MSTNKGDTLRLTLNYTLNSQALQEDAYDEIELQLNSQSNGNYVKLLYSQDEIRWDSTVSKYVANLSQEQTFKLKENEYTEDSEIQYQLRILMDSTVGSSAIGTFTLGPVLSKKVLEGDE